MTFAKLRAQLAAMNDVIVRVGIHLDETGYANAFQLAPQADDEAHSSAAESRKISPTPPAQGCLPSS
jgi:hypothetical protein